MIVPGARGGGGFARLQLTASDQVAHHAPAQPCSHPGTLTASPPWGTA